jgi:hypothetical protein
MHGVEHQLFLIDADAIGELIANRERSLAA